MIWSWKLKLKIEDENAHRKIALQDFKTAPQAAYNQIKLLNCACIEGKNILHHFNNIYLEYLNIIMIDIFDIDTISKNQN